MTDTLHLRQAAHGMRRLWWIPFVLACLGVIIGLTASERLAPIYRSQATVLVGPTNGAVTQSSSVRASESLASFYADMARRQIVLQPVVERLNLDEPWAQLRNRVSAVVPSDNLRLITVTVMDDSQRDANAVANELVDQLVSLSPALPGGNSQAFINGQVDSLKQTIEETQLNIDRLQAEAAAATDTDVVRELRQEVTVLQDRLVNWQRVYVELIAAEPTADAGGLQVLDEATPVTDMGRSGMVKQALVGGFVGAGSGTVVAWLLYRRGVRKDMEPNPVALASAPTSSRGTARAATDKQASEVREAFSRQSYGRGPSGNGRGTRARTGTGGDLLPRGFRDE